MFKKIIINIFLGIVILLLAISFGFFILPTKCNAAQKEYYLFPLVNPIKFHNKILCTSWYSKWRKETDKPAYQYKALNYPAIYGEPIRSPFDGVVDNTNISGYEGGSITLRNNDGVTTIRICHMSNFEILKYTNGVQTKVKRGQIIGYVGTSGRTTGSHIRVVIERNGERFFVNASIWGMKPDDFEYSKTEFDSNKTEFYMSCK